LDLPTNFWYNSKARLFFPVDCVGCKFVTLVPTSSAVHLQWPVRANGLFVSSHIRLQFRPTLDPLIRAALVPAYLHLTAALLLSLSLSLSQLPQAHPLATRSPLDLRPIICLADHSPTVRNQLIPVRTVPTVCSNRSLPIRSPPPSFRSHLIPCHRTSTRSLCTLPPFLPFLSFHPSFLPSFLPFARPSFRPSSRSIVRFRSPNRSPLFSFLFSRIKLSATCFLPKQIVHPSSCSHFIWFAHASFFLHLFGELFTKDSPRNLDDASRTVISWHTIFVLPLVDQLSTDRP
jgi:hypothetical protein